MKLTPSIKSLTIAGASAMLFVGLSASAGILEVDSAYGKYTDERCQFNDGSVPPQTECTYDPTTYSDRCIVVDWCPEPEPEVE